MSKDLGTEPVEIYDALDYSDITSQMTIEGALMGGPKPRGVRDISGGGNP